MVAHTILAQMVDVPSLAGVEVLGQSETLFKTHRSLAVVPYLEQGEAAEDGHMTQEGRLACGVATRLAEAMLLQVGHSLPLERPEVMVAATVEPVRQVRRLIT